MKLPKTELTSNRRVKPKQPSEDAGSDAEAAAGRAVPLPSVPLSQDRSLLIPRWGDNDPESLSTATAAETAAVTKPVKTPPPVRWTRFEFVAPEGRTVFLAGSFNNWNPSATPMMRLHGRKWVKELWLPAGRYEYQFVVDGRWRPDLKAADEMPNPFGGFNSVVEVSRSL